MVLHGSFGDCGWYSQLFLAVTLHPVSDAVAQPSSTGVQDCPIASGSVARLELAGRGRAKLNGEDGRASGRFLRDLNDLGVAGLVPNSIPS